MTQGVSKFKTKGATNAPAQPVTAMGRVVQAMTQNVNSNRSKKNKKSKN